MKILLYANGSAQNHGCEAIKNTTVQLLGENRYFIGSTNVSYDRQIPNAEYIQYTFKKKYALRDRILCRLRLKKGAKGKLQLDQFLPYFKDCDLAVSVGGDNYCYGENDWLYYLHDMAKDAGKPSVLWGASLDESMIDDSMEADFWKYDMIVVRESISYEVLQRKQIPNVYLCPDPAFMLKAVRPERFDAGFDRKKKYIGINISPLVQRREKIDGIVWRNVQNTVNYILQNTDYDVMLIPHVVTDDNNDYELLRSYKNQFSSERVVLIEDHSCEELKYYISCCDMMIAARTHASIAAYSQCIPTLVIGYSVKSRGIARDLFGTEENYVLPVDRIIKDDSLLNTFKYLLERKDEIQEHLNMMMPGYIGKIEAVAAAIKTLVPDSKNNGTKA